MKEEEKRLLWPKSELGLNITLGLLGLCFAVAAMGLCFSVLHSATVDRTFDVAWKFLFGLFLAFFAVGWISGVKQL